jgi:hypothetical protein
MSELCGYTLFICQLQNHIVYSSDKAMADVVIERAAVFKSPQSRLMQLIDRSMISIVMSGISQLLNLISILLN